MDYIKYLIGLFILIGSCLQTLSLQCYELSCNGTNCLGMEVASNPLLIKKCDRVIYKGCYTVTTVLNGFSLTTTGCVDRLYECTPDRCDGIHITTNVACCNTDLCNNGSQSSSADTNHYFAWKYLVLYLIMVSCRMF